MNDGVSLYVEAVRFGGVHLVEQHMQVSVTVTGWNPNTFDIEIHESSLSEADRKMLKKHTLPTQFECWTELWEDDKRTERFVRYSFPYVQWSFEDRSDGGFGFRMAVGRAVPGNAKGGFHFTDILPGGSKTVRVSSVDGHGDETLHESERTG